MLKGQKQIALREAPRTHVDLFIEHYDMLRGWALHFTKHDPDLAQDLLHDAFIHFTLTKPELAHIENVESYLYVIMRNLHLSQIRKSSRIPTRPLGVIEYDTIDLGLWATDPRDHQRLRDDLSAICQYACIRKETLKAASVLILRFFHGYYPEEIADVMRTTRAMVDNRLRMARAEVHAYLESPDRVSFIDHKGPEQQTKKVDVSGPDLRLALRREIFASARFSHRDAASVYPLTRSTTYTHRRTPTPSTLARYLTALRARAVSTLLTPCSTSRCWRADIR
jgi:RNA polymerase sigma factor (sigma-70 family)